MGKATTPRPRQAPPAYLGEEVPSHRAIPQPLRPAEMAATLFVVLFLLLFYFFFVLEGVLFRDQVFCGQGLLHCLLQAIPTFLSLRNWLILSYRLFLKTPQF
jgi:hypothetical protein